MAEVVLDHVQKRFGAVTILEDLSLHVQDREFLVLVGPSGCGKSTALRLIAGLEAATGGDIYIGDRRVNDVAPRDRDVAMVFQSYALYPHLSVYDNLAFALKLRHTARPEIERRVTAAAASLGLDGLLERKPRELSGGQRQRVALGRAIVREPQVFLMDEPLSNLDAQLRVQTRIELSKLHQRLETTVIYVTHDQVEAMTMGARIAVLRAGVLQQLDTPQKLYDQPANLFVARFIGSPAMNCFPGRLVGDGAELAVELGTLRIVLPARAREPLAAYHDQEVVLGIRPEHIHGPDPGSGTAGGQMVRAAVEVVETLGAELFVYLRRDEREFVARLAPHHRPRVGESVEVLFETDKLHLFDGQTERRLI